MGQLYQTIFHQSTSRTSYALNGLWTSILLGLLGGFAFLLQLHKPVTCWTPAPFREAHVSFTTQHCWQANFVNHPFTDQNVPLVSTNVLDEESTRTLYQWFPLILVFQALLFKLPDIIWRTGQASFGFDVNKVLDVSSSYNNIHTADRKQVGKQLARYIYKYMESSTIKGCPWGLITLLCIFVDCLYLVNVVSQFALFNNFLATSNGNVTHNYGSRLLQNFQDSNASSWFTSDAFPRSVMCEIEIRQLQNIQKWAVQCNLAVNLWYNMIGALVWIWLLVVMIVTIFNCLKDALIFVIPCFRNRFYKSYLSMLEDQRPVDGAISSFSSAMGQDVVTILQILGYTSNSLLVGDTVIGLWEIHTKTPETNPSSPGYTAVHVPQGVQNVQPVNYGDANQMRNDYPDKPGNPPLYPIFNQ